MERMGFTDTARLCARHVRLLNSPFIFVACFLSAWYLLFFRNGIHVTGNDAESWTLFFTFLTVFHAFFATDALKKVWGEYITLREYVRIGDEEGFRAEMHKRIPFAIKAFLFVMTVIVQCMAMVFPFDTLLFGALANGLLAFVLGLFWEVAVNLDDPVNGIWYKDMVPPSWLTPRKET